MSYEEVESAITYLIKYGESLKYEAMDEPEFREAVNVLVARYRQAAKNENAYNWIKCPPQGSF